MSSCPPALDRATRGGEVAIERRGIGFSRAAGDGGVVPALTHVVTGEGEAERRVGAVAFGFERFGAVTPEACASDHCPVFVELP